MTIFMLLKQPSLLFKNKKNFSGIYYVSKEGYSLLRCPAMALVCSDYG